MVVLGSIWCANENCAEGDNGDDEEMDDDGTTTVGLGKFG